MPTCWAPSSVQVKSQLCLPRGCRIFAVYVKYSMALIDEPTARKASNTVMQ